MKNISLFFEKLLTDMGVKIIRHRFYSVFFKTNISYYVVPNIIGQLFLNNYILT